VTHAPSPSDERVVLLAPTRRDSETASQLMREAGIEVTASPTFAAALDLTAHGAAALILPEETIAEPGHHAALVRRLREQPPWSDLPLLVLARSGVDSEAATDAVRTLGNVTLLERPLRVATLLSAVRTAIRARQRQYQTRDHLAERAVAEAGLRLADRRKDEFLATLGHELRNPLAPIVSSLHLLRRTGVTPAAIAQAVEVIERQVSHLTGLVDDLLELSRITRGIIDIRRDPVDLAAAIRGAVETVAPAIARAGQRLRLDLPSAASVEGDALRLTQIFVNLLTNATKYTDSGGLIEVVARSAGDRVVASVRDSGIGIAPEHLQGIFEMFTQIDREHRASQGGLGIGLTLVKSLVELHGGSVEARSAGLGQGSEFVVDLPAAAVGVAPTAPAGARRELPGLRVMIVDDNVDAADTLGMLLETLGASVRVAHDGAAALALLETFTPDAMLLDIGMPRLDGYELARRIRSRPEHRHTHLIALTGWGQASDIGQSTIAGFDHHIVKPPDIGRLIDVLSAQGPPSARPGTG
jgi:two-component system, sensor histidine kinase